MNTYRIIFQNLPQCTIWLGKIFYSFPFFLPFAGPFSTDPSQKISLHDPFLNFSSFAQAKGGAVVGGTVGETAIDWEIKRLNQY